MEITESKLAIQGAVTSISDKSTPVRMKSETGGAMALSLSISFLLPLMRQKLSRFRIGSARELLSVFFGGRS